MSDNRNKTNLPNSETNNPCLTVWLQHAGDGSVKEAIYDHFPCRHRGKTPLSLQSFQQCEHHQLLPGQGGIPQRAGWVAGQKRGGSYEKKCLCLRRCHSGSSWCLGGIRERGEARLTDTDEGRQTPTQSILPSHPSSPSKGKQSNKTVPETAAMPTLMPSPGPSNHLI